MPPYMVDEAPLLDMARTLRGLAESLDRFAGLAAKAGEGRGHADPLVRINGSLAEIAEAVHGLGGVGDHSAAYERIERSFRAIADAVEAMSGR